MNGVEETTSSLMFRLPPCNNTIVNKMMEQARRIMVERCCVNVCGDTVYRSSEEDSSGSSEDSVDSVIHVGDEVKESHKLRFDMLKRKYKCLLANRCFINLACLKSSPDFYKRLLEYLFHICNKKKRVRYNYKLRYLSASLFTRLLKIMHDWGRNVLLNKDMKKMAFVMIYLCINMAAKYVIKKSIFTMRDITAKAKRCGCLLEASDMKDLSNQFMSLLVIRLKNPNIHSFLEAMLPLTFLKKKYSIARFMTNAALVMDFFHVHFIEIFKIYYKATSTEASERSYSLEKHVLLISASIIYVTFQKFYVKESVHPLLFEMLIDLAGLTGYSKRKLLLFAYITLRSIDGHEIESE